MSEGLSCQMATSDLETPSRCARDIVLAIPELLEAVILALPDNDVLAYASRVSRAWNDAIRLSPQIQKQLFLPTATSKPISPLFWDNGASPPIPCYSSNIRLNNRFGPVNDYTPDLNPEYGPLKVHNAHFAWRTTSVRLAKASYWSRFLTDPPCTTMTFQAVRRNQTFIKETMFTLYNPEGLTELMFAKEYIKVLKHLEEQRSDETKVWGVIGNLALKLDSTAAPPGGEAEEQHERSNIRALVTKFFTKMVLRRFRRWARRRLHL